MKQNDLRGFLVVGLVFLLVQLPVQGANVPLGRIIPAGDGSALNGTGFKLQSTLFSGDKVTAGTDSWVLVLLLQGDQVQLGPAGSMSVTGSAQEVLVTLERGLAAARSGGAQLVSISAGGLMVRPSGKAKYQVAIQADAIVVTSQEGALSVQASNRTLVVPSGKAMKFVLAANVAPGRTGVGSNSLNEAAVGIILVATAIAIGTAVAIENENSQPVSPSSP